MGLLTLLITLLILSFLAYGIVTRTTHGKVEFKTGLALKFLKDYTGDDVLVVRKQFKKMMKTDYAKKLPISTVDNLTIGTSQRQVPVRFYSDSDSNTVPLIIFIHGGGWCIGDLDSHDQQCRRLVKETGFALLAVDYALSPEAKFPVALNETVEIIMKLTSGEIDLKADTTKLAIIGDSAGGNMTITSALKLIESGDDQAIKCIVPVYPVTNCVDGKTGSFTKFSEGYILTAHLMDLFNKNYIAEGQNLKDPYLSPLFSDTLHQLPPCFVLTAAYDPLRDEGEQFADKLKSLGNQVELKRYENCVHSFFGQQEFGQNGLVAVKDVSTFLKKHLK